jgi:2-polyprenyl-3-methyl-5-hydroxy-6-metoxy-1,4-benzoquinol methylase
VASTSLPTQTGTESLLLHWKSAKDTDVRPRGELTPGDLEAQTAFDAKAKEWEAYTVTPLGRLRQELTLYHLGRHLQQIDGPLEVLDAGCGTGSYGVALAADGHRVCLLDFAASMLEAAKQKVETVHPKLLDRLSFHCSAVEEVKAQFGTNAFDLILCHTLLEYVEEPGNTIQVLAHCLRPGGTMSLLCANRHADVLRWIWAKGNPEMAQVALDKPTGSADLFGLPRRTFYPLEVHQALDNAGLSVTSHRGIRIMADYVPPERLEDTGFYQQLFELEVAVGARAEYQAIARYIHLLAEYAI